jgi:voltage-gated potassium channel
MPAPRTDEHAEEPVAAAPGTADRSDDVPVRRRPAEEREQLAEAIAARMDGPVTVLGVIFLLLVLVDTVGQPAGGVARAFEIASWVLWAVFVAEFVVRAAVAPSFARFFQRNWWQLIFLALPFLRFVRVLTRLHGLGRIRSVSRGGRVLSSAVRSSRTATRKLSGRIGWLGAVTVIVVLAASQLLFEFAGFETYGDALHAAALATVAGAPLGREGTLAKVLDVVLTTYSVVVFATLAGTLGAFFLERRDEA